MTDVARLSELLVLSVLNRLQVASPSKLSVAIEQAIQGRKVPFCTTSSLVDLLRRDADKRLLVVGLSTRGDLSARLTRTGKHLVMRKEPIVLKYFPGLRKINSLSTRGEVSAARASL